MRVNVVRKSGEFATTAGAPGRDIEGYYDASLWEKKKLEGDEALKRMIREGVENTSCVCVLIGTETWQRRWVKYEIARSVVDGRGLMAVHINSINHHQRVRPDERGYNPCGILGLAAHVSGNYYLVERKFVNGAWVWEWYQDYTTAVSVPRYMKPPTPNHPVRLAEVTREYDWSQNGHRNIGGWLDLAATEAGR
ncbi:TIR domain-containing protein [Rhizobium sp. PEPV16]|nr:TIR domain-containing protein [Rhizobium sp. PEPV16]